MNNLEREAEDNVKVLNWFQDHLNELPMIEQIQYALAITEFVNKLKPIYIEHMIRESKEQKNEQINTTE